MRCRLLLLLTGAAALMAPPSSAETGKGALRVSATVVRSCRVSTDLPSARVDCGAGSTPVQIVSPTTSTDSAARSADQTRAVTIEF